jgi:hypothetical protein
MNDFIPDKKTYQSNRRRMAWAALGMMIVCTGAVILDPARMAQADADADDDVRIAECFGWRLLRLCQHGQSTSSARA